MEYFAIVKSNGSIPLENVISDFERMWTYSTTVIIISSSASSSWVYAAFELMKKGVDVKVVQLDSLSFGARFTTLGNNQLLHDLGVPTVMFASHDDLDRILIPEYHSQTVSLVDK